jgi:eukaryotic-like serine/threonine-protein kinase
MGVVYEAFDVELKRQVAVKVIRLELLASRGALARFRREARIAAGLPHPAVVAIYDFGLADDGRAYIVMEMLKGRTLREALRERGRLDARGALDILRGVCGAVALAHQNGLIHRDLKPENTFLAQFERRQVAKVLDFGLARPLAPGSTDSVTCTAPGALAIDCLRRPGSVLKLLEELDAALRADVEERGYRQESPSPAGQSRPD